MTEKVPIKDVVLAGFARWYPEGGRFWTKKEVHGLMNPRGETHEFTDPDIKQMLQELVAEGRIRLIGEEEKFLEVLSVEGL